MAHLASGGISLLTAVPAPTTVEPLIGVTVPADTITKVWEEAHSTARNYLQNVTRRLEAGGLQVRSEVADDLPANAIIAYARQNPDIALIAMATHGFSGVRRWVFGSVAERVLHNAPRPVLLVRPSKPVARERSESQWPVASRGLVDSGAKALTTDHWSLATRLDIIVVPLDGSSFAEKALEEARRMALLSGATLVLVSAISVPDSAEPAQEEFMPVWARDAREHETARLAHYLTNTAERLCCAPGAQGLKVCIELVHGHPAEMILLTADRLHADLIVMATHGRGGMQRLWLGSVAQKLVQGSKLPVLLMRPVEVESHDQDTAPENFEAAPSTSSGIGMAAIVHHHY
jgi:nucleotide-binding universal stress UspA family protein